jgi:hypothetical protein
MASLALSVAGAAIGFYLGGPTGAEIGWMAGSMAGSMLFPQNTQGPRLEDRGVHLTSYGQGVPITYGSTREQGAYVWASDLHEQSHTQSAKGGPTTTSYTYTVDAAVLLCAGPVAGILRIWANKRLIYDASAASGAVTYDPVIGGMRIYLGSETQTPDALLVAATGDHPAYRGCCYVVFENLDVSTHFGNRPPLIEAEIATHGSSALPAPVVLLDVATTYGGAFYTAPVRDPNTGYVWTAVREGAAGSYTYWMYAYNDASGNLIRIPFPTQPVSYPQCLTLVESTREVWCIWESYPYGSIPFIAVFSADGFVSTGTINRPGTMSGWAGSLAYDADQDKVLVGLTNLGGTVYVLEPLARTLDGSVESGILSAHLIPMSGTGLTAVWWTSSTSVHFIRYTGVGPGGYSYAGSVTLPNYLGGFAYDSLRHRLAYFPNYASGTDPIRVVDGVTLAVTDYPNTDYAIASQGTAIYHVQNDAYYAIGGSFSSNILTGLDAATFTPIFQENYGSASGNTGYLLEVPGVKTYLFSQGGYFSSQYRRLFLVPLLDAAGVTLASIVQDICLRAGLYSGDLNTAALTDLVDGYSLRQVMTGRAAIEPLMTAFAFDAVESDAKLKFVKRGGPAVVSIPEDDLAAHDSGGAPPDQLLFTRAQELELPVEVLVQYVDAAFDYQTSAQYARRLASPSKAKTSVQLAINMTATQAREVARMLLNEVWMSRTGGDLALSTKYAYLEPTDVIQVSKAGHTYTVRLQDKTEARGIYGFKAVTTGASVYSPDASGLSLPGAAATPPGSTVAVATPTALRLLDIPLLRDLDDGVGFYALASGYTGGTWPGAQLYKSSDGGYSWLAYGAAFFTPAPIGTTAGVLGDFGGGTIFDETNALTVDLIDASLTLTSTSELNVLNGQNAALVGNEIIQYKNATLVAAGRYVLSGLLRGRRGTEWAMSTHVAGDRFVALSSATVALEAATSAEWNLARLYRAVTFGALLTDAANIPFTDTAVAQKCYAPVQLGGGRDAAGNLTLKWTRRTRTGGAWNDSSDVPLGEDSENYVIEIYASSAYATLKRTLTATTNTVSYSAANQTTDFGSPQGTVYWRVAQVSATTGNGTFAKGST